MPCSWLFQYLPVNGRSVPALRVTSNCSGVSCAFHSASVLCTFSISSTPLRFPSSVKSTTFTILPAARSTPANRTAPVVIRKFLRRISVCYFDSVNPKVTQKLWLEIDRNPPSLDNLKACQSSNIPVMTAERNSKSLSVALQKRIPLPALPAASII